jgi:polysaccharide biosynthesis protein PslH
MNILFLTTIIMSKNCNGGEVASQCFIDALRKLGHEVSVVGYLRKGDKSEYNSQETLVVDERYTETSKSKFNALVWMLKSYLLGLPYSSTKYYSRKYITLVQELLSKQKYDLIVIDHAQLGWLEKYITNKNRLIMLAHNIEHEMYAESSRKTGNLLSNWIYQREAHLMRVQEEHLCNSAQEIWTLTEHDNQYFANIKGFNNVKTFEITPRSCKLQNQEVIKCFDIGLLGSWSWKANIEALEWFLQAVYPHLPANASIHIAGKGADWLKDKYPNITYRGVVPDAQEFMSQARVVAIPTLSGGGIQIKTLDAIASGSYIVATPVAMRGISHPPSTVKITALPEDFANFLIDTTFLLCIKRTVEEAKDWYRIRQDKFVQEIAAVTR